MSGANLPQIPDVGGMEVEMGKKVSSRALEKFKGSANQKEILTIITKNPIVIKSHYDEEIAKFRFFAMPQSLKDGMQIDIHYGFLAIRWNADKKGLKILREEDGSYSYEMVALVVGPKNYDKLVSKFELNGELHQYLMQVTTSDEKFQAMDFEIISGQKPPFMTDKSMFATIKQQMTDLKPHVPFAQAQVLTPETYLSKKQGGVSESESASFDATSQVADDNVLGAGPGQEGFQGFDTGVEDAEVVTDDTPQLGAGGAEMEQSEEEKKNVAQANEEETPDGEYSFE